MFDPTAFENLKVVAEGAMYDLDLDGEITITNRKDIINLASLSRSYEVSFVLQKGIDIEATFLLSVDVQNLSGEILEASNFTPGCSLHVIFDFPIVDPEKRCQHIEGLLQSIWGKERMITQQISYEYNKQAVSYHNKVSVSFQKAITEDHVDDLPAVISYMIDTIRTLQHFLQKQR